MSAAEIQVDYVSPQGGFVPLDPRSMKYTDQAIMETYETPDFQWRALSDSLTPDQVNPEDYVAIYYTGGHGVMWDFPDNQALQQIALAIYQQGGFITSVCHGIAGLLNIRDAEGHYLIANKSVTGFTTAEEVIAGKKNQLSHFSTKPQLKSVVGTSATNGFIANTPFKMIISSLVRILSQPKQ